MARGTVSGILTGAVVSAIGVFVVAVAVDRVELTTGDVAEVAEVETGEEVSETPAETPAETPTDPPSEADTPEGDTPAPEAATPEPETPADPETEGTADESLAAASPEPEAPDPDPATPPEADDLALAAPDPDPAPQSDPSADPAPAAEPDPAPETPVAPEPTAPEAATPEDTGPEATVPEATTPDPQDEVPQVVTGRLPNISDGPDDAEEEAAAPVPAIERNAIPYSGDPVLPKMSVLLIDQGESREDVGDLAVMPFPLSVVVDASAPDAEEAVSYYRDVGAEIILTIPLPEGATATDVDVTFQVYEPLLEDVVAVMFPEDAGFQALGDAAAQVATILTEQGLGLVTYPSGLNTGHKRAVSDGVSAGLVFRDLDGDGQAPDVIRRFLDNVAFRARNDEGVIAVARVRPDSLQALLEWSLGNRAQTVNMAPVSATLRDD